MTLLLKNLGRRFGARPIFRALDLTAAPGARIAVTGANGAGKTTLLRVLATALAPSEGEVSLGGAPLSVARRNIAWVPAIEGGFVPRLTGRENLDLFASLRGIARSDVEARLSCWLRLAPLEAALRAKYQECSTGMRQSLHLARAGIARPALLLLDEPTRSLDRTTAASLRDLVAELPGIVVFSNHHDESLMAVATQTVAL